MFAGVQTQRWPVPSSSAWRRLASILLLQISLAGAVCGQAPAGSKDSSSAEEAAKGFRIFTNSQGRTVEARLLSVLNDQAKIELKSGGAVVSWPIAAFSETDQGYMKKWASENISYRFVVRHRVQTSPPPKPVSGTRYNLNYKGGSRSLTPGGFGADDDDSETQYITVSLTNGSSAELQDLEVAVWVILSHKETHRSREDTSSFVSHGAGVRIRSAPVGQNVDLAGGFTVKKIRLKALVPSTSGGQGVLTVPTYREKAVGSIRETVAGVLIRVYHEEKLVDEISSFDSDLKNSDYDTNFAKPVLASPR